MIQICAIGRKRLNKFAESEHLSPTTFFAVLPQAKYWEKCMGNYNLIDEYSSIFQIRRE